MEENQPKIHPNLLNTKVGPYKLLLSIVHACCVLPNACHSPHVAYRSLCKTLIVCKIHNSYFKFEIPLNTYVYQLVLLSAIICNKL